MKKYYLIILVVISLVLMVIGVIIMNYKPKKADPIVDNTEPEETEIIDVDSYMGNLYTILFKYANEIYDKKAYANYPKIHFMYFVSLKDLESDFGYDISMFKGPKGKQCDINKSGISYDIDNYMNAKYTDSYRPIFCELIGCVDDVASSEISK